MPRPYNILGISEYPAPPAPVESRAPLAIPHTRAFAGGRVTMDKGDSYFGGVISTWVAPQNAEDEWRRLKLDGKTLDRISPSRLMSLLVDLSPEVSRALWDYLRLGNPGWEIKVTRPNSATPFKRGKDTLDEFIALLTDYYGAVDIVYNRLMFSAFLRGAMLAELVLDESGRQPVDLVTPDPWCVRFKRKEDPMRGRIWQLGQWQKGQWVEFDRPTIRYTPIDPASDSPYGRPMCSPALFATLFLLGMLHDLRRVVAQQGYPRLHITIDLQKLVEGYPQAKQLSKEDFKKWIDSIRAEVEEHYAKLEPDDAFVSTDVIDIGAPVGTLDIKSLGALAGVIEALERLAIRALKTMPILMASNQSTTETQANRQWEIHIAGVKSLQHLSETMLGRLYTLALQCQGIAAKVVIRFAEIRAAEELRDQQVLTMKIGNARKAYDSGYISQDEAAMMAVGKEKADQPAPRVAADDGDDGVPDTNDSTVDPGTMRRPGLTVVR
ncbi:MAG: hypothetical protein L0229_22515 [Blastocatellia bacterium]|nr:hypothetical protein [Blastocatellia bacterium]